MALDDILTDAKPFGPNDQAFIDIIADAVALLDIGEPLRAALSGNYTLIYGRKGCGKSSVISIFEGAKHAQRRLESKNIVIDDLAPKNLSVKINTWDRFLDIETQVIRLVTAMAGERGGKPIDYELVPPEVVEQVWIDQIWDQIFRSLRDLAFDDHSLYNSIPNVMLCFDDAQMARMRGTPDYIASKLFNAAKEDILEMLRSGKVSISVLFDSMERYPVRNETFSLSMSGFLRAINTLSMRHKRLRVVFALPEELLPFFRSASSNILKDFQASFALRWTPNDLLRIAAHRYRLFLQIHDPEYYSNISSIDISKPVGISRFYSSLLPDFIINENGIEEPARSYLIRHTHLLPRHIIMALNEISQVSFQATRHWRRFTAESIKVGVRRTEEHMAHEILQPYEVAYNGLGKVLTEAFKEAPPVFPANDLQNIYIKRMPYLWDLDKVEMTNLLFRIGIIGRVATPQDDRRYCMSEFFFNSSGNISFSATDEICLHPIYSRHFNAFRRRNGDKRVIYPIGVST